MPLEDNYPTANIVFEARCEVTKTDICPPIRLAISQDSGCLALTAAGGYRGTDSSVHYWYPDQEDPKLNERTISARLAEPAQHIILDEARKLIFVADSDRIKSFIWDEDGTPVHTMASDLKSNKYTGPLALLADGRLLRAGRGSALVWNLDKLQTHGPDHTQIGTGFYESEDNLWRDDLEAIEPSTGSPANAVLKFFDPILSPAEWLWHQPTRLMLCAESGERSNYRCFSMDLSRGQLSTHYKGHSGQVLSFSASAGDPHTFATASSDGHCRIYDIRQSMPQVTCRVEDGSSKCSAVAVAHLDGIPGRSSAYI